MLRVTAAVTMAAAAPPAEAPAGANNAEALQLNDELVDTLMLLDSLLNCNLSGFHK